MLSRPAGWPLIETSNSIQGYTLVQGRAYGGRCSLLTKTFGFGLEGEKKKRIQSREEVFFRNTCKTHPAGVEYALMAPRGLKA